MLYLFLWLILFTKYITYDLITPFILIFLVITLAYKMHNSWPSNSSCFIILIFYDMIFQWPLNPRYTYVNICLFYFDCFFLLFFYFCFFIFIHKKKNSMCVIYKITWLVVVEGISDERSWTTVNWVVLSKGGHFYPSNLFSIFFSLSYLYLIP